MHITTIAHVLSILGLLSSFYFVGIIPSIFAFALNIYCILNEKSINTARALAISFVGIILPLIMYFSSYGFRLPYEKKENLGMVSQIVYDNYTRLGFDMHKMLKDKNKTGEETLVSAEGDSEDYYYVSEGVIHDESGFKVSIQQDEESETLNISMPEKNVSGIKERFGEDSIFESIDSLSEDEKKSSDIFQKAPSDDDMPSYGGLPVGTLILGQYFREDDHNCNPVLVLKNQTGEAYRFECKFTARDEDGNELATSEKTVEVVKQGMPFVFEGRFDKGELQGKLPAMYEFLISKRKPYEKDLADEVAVYSEVVDNSAYVVADNHSEDKAKVDSYVLFFDGDELVDCIWMIPKNSGEVCIEPGSSAAIRGDSYYKFDRIETYYTAYEAVGE